MITCQMSVLIVSIKKFSIVIGSPRAYLPRNRRAITWVSNYRYPIWTFCNWTPVIGYPHDLHVNYARFNGFLCNVSYSFENLWNALHTFFAQKKFSKDIFNSEICYRLDLVSYNSGSNRARNFKSVSRFVLVRFWNYSRDYSLNCTPLLLSRTRYKVSHERVLK